MKKTLLALATVLAFTGAVYAEGESTPPPAGDHPADAMPAKKAKKAKKGKKAAKMKEEKMPPSEGAAPDAHGSH